MSNISIDELRAAAADDSRFTAVAYEIAFGDRRVRIAERARSQPHLSAQNQRRATGAGCCGRSRSASRRARSLSI
jgi:hypothetical protein